MPLGSTMSDDFRRRVERAVLAFERGQHGGGPGGSRPRQILPSRGLRFRYQGSDDGEMPAYAVIAGNYQYDDGQPALYCRQFDCTGTGDYHYYEDATHRELFINGPRAVAYGGYGVCYHPSEIPVSARYATVAGATVAAQESMGPISGSWDLYPGMPGFIVAGSVSGDNHVMVRAYTGGVYWIEASHDWGMYYAIGAAHPVGYVKGWFRSHETTSDPTYDGTGVLPEVKAYAHISHYDNRTLNVAAGDYVACRFADARQYASRLVLDATYLDDPVGTVKAWDDPANIPKGWEELTAARGRAIFGYDSGDGDFNSISDTGGSKTHTHSLTTGGSIAATGSSAVDSASGMPPYCVRMWIVRVA